MKALLLSGGLESSALAWWKRPDICVTVDYGQIAARGEIAASTALCKILRLRHRTISVDLSALGSGSMVGRRKAKGGKAIEFWPFRNQVLLTLSAMVLQPAGFKEIMIGAVATDVHADGRPPFLRAIDRATRIQEGRIRISAPAQRMDSVALLRRSKFPQRLVGLTFSCHVHEYACGLCRGCVKHREVIRRTYMAVAQPTGRRQSYRGTR